MKSLRFFLEETVFVTHRDVVKYTTGRGEMEMPLVLVTTDISGSRHYSYVWGHIYFIYREKESLTAAKKKSEVQKENPVNSTKKGMRYYHRDR